MINKIIQTKKKKKEQKSDENFIDCEQAKEPIYFPQKR